VELILLEKMRNLGGLGQKVKVKPGYGRNYLIPQGKAVYATASNVAKFEAERAALEAKAAKELAFALERKQSLLSLGSINITAVSGEEGKLFGSIGARDIASAIDKLGFNINKKEVILPDLIRSLGEYEVVVELHNEVSALIKVAVISG